MMKKVLTLFLLLLVPITIVNAKEKTIAQWETELNKTQKELESNNAKKNQTESEITARKQKINSIYSEVEKINNEITSKTEESKKLEEDIKKKNIEIQDLMRYYQVSSSGTSMLEYVMGAESITDLIYRLSITEQITTHNKKRISEMNDMIKQNEQIKVDLDNKKTELAKLNKDLNDQVASLNVTKSELDDAGHSLSESIKEMQKTISSLKKMGCKSNETQTTCLNRIYSGKYLPSGTTFYRPTVSGRISSNYGWRTLYGRANNHAAIDISVPTGTSVYAVATGRVAKVISSSKGGGNQIIIHHQINGKYYTSYYAHLSSFNTSVGAVVTKDTVIAKSGSTGNSTGPHLHLGLARGKWYSDYYDYYGSSGFVGHSFDPREVIVFPPKGRSYSNR